MAKLFYLHKRTGKKPVFYVQFRGENGQISSAISTGQSSKSAAERWAFDFLKKGGSLPTQGRLTFEQYAADWWIFEKCPYCRAKMARGFHISRAYAAVRRSYLNRYVLPEFGAVKLSDINPRKIEAWLMRLKDLGTLAPATCNRILGTLKVMLAEAVRLQIIPMNPTGPIGDLKETPKPRGILDVDAMRQLFDPARAAEIWGNDPRHYTANLLAASTGMRLGEVQGLMRKYVHPSHIEVMHSWNDTFGLSQPKWNSAREIPIPSKVAGCLQALMASSPYQEPEDLVFWSRDGAHPLTKTTLLAGLRRAYTRSGIPLADQKSRNLCFHSWRHGFNTLVRGKVPDEQLRRVTGHKTIAMSDQYDHARAAQLGDVLAAQEILFS